MMGAVCGDIIGEPREWKNVKSIDFPLFLEKSRFTDDTVCTMAIAQAILDGTFDFKASLRRLCPLYPAAGYGKGFAVWLEGTSDGPYNSYGNGSAMRCSPCGWAAKTLDEALDLAKRSAEVTHNHPHGIAGAQSVAGAIWMGRNGKTKDEIKSWVVDTFKYNLDRKTDDIRPTYKFDVTCQGSVPESFIAFLESTDYESAVRLGISLGGDSDTIGCITGSIAEAFYKKIPEEISKEAVARLDSRLRNILLAFIEEYY